MKLKYIESACSGCRTCQVVCSLKNFKEVNPAKAALIIEGRFPAPGEYEVHVCDQCGLCVEACPTLAIQNENGIYFIDEESCIGCLNCVAACPKGVMIAHRELNVPFKCTNCGECVEICPRDALQFQE